MEEQKKKSVQIENGIIKISKKGFKSAKFYYLDDMDDFRFLGNEEYLEKYTLHTRFSDGYDIVKFNLEKESFLEEYDVPYNPLIESIHEKIVEYSNCSSVEFDEKGSMIIGIGENSKFVKRKNNNYRELVSNWDEFFGNYGPDTLEVEFYVITDSRDENNNFGIFVQVELIQKKATRREIQFVFKNCSNFHLCVTLYGINYYCINMSKLTNGNIFVDFDGLGITFECQEIIACNNILWDED